MSRATETWTVDSPERWAQGLGLVCIPLFGSERARQMDGTHALLQDGERGSFVFSVRNADSPDEISPLLSWCWSSNVTFGVIVRPAARFITLHRWDERDSVRRVTVENERSARSLCDKLASTARPRAPSAVQRLIALFRSLRRALSASVGPERIIRVFNSFLLGADAVRQEVVTREQWLGCRSLSELLALLAARQVIPSHEGSDTMEAPRSFRVQEFADVFVDPDPVTGCTLDTNLLLRHASGLLYQEAHLELERPAQAQGRLFGIPSGQPEKGEPKSDARFTAPPLARLLAEQALKAHSDMSGQRGPAKITVLDPACGSGNFLVEAWREISLRRPGVAVQLVGYDQSSIACEMAEFCVRHTIDAGAEVNVRQRDSLDELDWEAADVVLMNPPFTSWTDMSQSERATVERILGALHHYQADKALAFVQRAVSSLKPGAVLACIVPAPLLESKAAFPWREHITNEPSLSLRLVGCFRGFGYFRGAVVEPAFFVIARLHGSSPETSSPVQVILAKDGYEDQAIRQLRRDPTGAEGDSPNWSVFEADVSEFRPASWLPRSRESAKRMRALTDSGHPKVEDLFRVRRGICTGHNKAFVHRRHELEQLGLSPSEMRWFRPAAGNATIRSGRLLDLLRIFYPYTGTGECAFAEESQLMAEVPNYYEKVLLRYKGPLEERRSLRGRHWWELIEPRRTWQPSLCPKIVSTYFGQRGSFAFDDQGRFAVTQGFGWLWRNGQAGGFASSPLPWAYLAVLNSGIFQSVLAHYCPTVRGGQYDLSVRFVRNVPLPDLTDATKVTGRAVSELAEYGRKITTGRFPPLGALDRAVSRVYGLVFEDWAVGEA
jgi:predicted RNA methylase